MLLHVFLRPKFFGYDIFLTSLFLKPFCHQVLKSRVDNYGKQFRDADTFSKEIQKDPLIEDEQAKQIEDHAQDMINRWSALKYDIEGRIDRLVEVKGKELFT